MFILSKMIEFIHQGDVEVSLGVLDDLGRFRHLDGGGTVNARFTTSARIPGDHIEVSASQPLTHFGDGGDGGSLIAGVDAFGE